MGILLHNEPLAKYTSWRVGGAARRLYIPDNTADLQEFLSATPAGEPLFWLGLGSNLLVRDGGVPATTIACSKLVKMQWTAADLLYVEAGTPCPLVAKFCAKQDMSGGEFLSGIPGTMGGALKMNAGAFGTEIWDLVTSVKMINSRGKITTRGVEEFTVGYRSVSGKVGEWFLAASILLQKTASQAAQRQIKKLLATRKAKQPTGKPTCGSVFKNPPNNHAAQLIEASGLKGYQLGGAKVSDKHANFIENNGNATAKDIESLIVHIQQIVLDTHNINLIPEVCMVGEAV